MNIFPEIGSTVTNVTTTKTGTAAKIEFSDGSSIYVKYDALVLSAPDKVQIKSTKPIVHLKNTPVAEGSRVAKHFANLPKKTIQIKKPSAVTEGSRVLDNGKVSKDALLAAQTRAASRIDSLSAKWDREHPSGEDTISAMNGS